MGTKTKEAYFNSLGEFHGVSGGVRVFPRTSRRFLRASSSMQDFKEISERFQRNFRDVSELFKRFSGVVKAFFSVSGACHGVSGGFRRFSGAFQRFSWFQGD